MGIKVRGLDKAKANMDRFVDDVVNVKSVRATQAALMIFGLEISSITPIDTSTLVNSLYRDLNVSGNLVVGRVGMSANYAAYVNSAPGTLMGRTRPKGRGMYWGPNGEVNFFDKGISRAMGDADRAIKAEMSR